MNFQKNPPDELELNITPLIDVVFLLLIFFMVSTTFDHESPLNITLPEASKEIAETKPEDAVTVFIDAQSDTYINSYIYINEKKLLDSKLSTIKEAIYDITAATPDAQIIIRADRTTPYQTVLTVMDAARQLKLVNITLPTITNEEDH